ncbi:hypothetical protein E2C01_038637 [Portunus trituberculatus]|uniref:Uncharacterized protein n=1 Tax=Portunus trituberculatus TaxID=210409 RepID=A0A5B7FHC3_PORTR|nr:hypothetical protein [Portunus trituberculatus]
MATQHRDGSSIPVPAKGKAEKTTEGPTRPHSCHSIPSLTFLPFLLLLFLLALTKRKYEKRPTEKPDPKQNREDSHSTPYLVQETPATARTPPWPAWGAPRPPPRSLYSAAPGP